MCQPVNHRCNQHFVLDDFIPSVESQISRNNCRFLSRPERQVIEQHFSSFFVATDVSELVTDDQVIFLKLVL